MKVYRIRDYEDHFEKSQTRKFKHIPKWVPLPTKHDGKGYRRIMALPDEEGAIVFAGWVLIVQVGAKCPTRGLLLDSDGPLTAEDLSFKTGCPKSVFKKTLELLTREEIGWMECEEYNPESGREPFSSATSPPVAQEQQKQLPLQDSTEQDSTEQESKESLSVRESELIAVWNKTPGVIQNRGPSLTAKRRSQFRQRIRDPSWDWVEALKHFPLKCFDQPDAWKPDIEWFLRPDSVTKILDGKYAWTKAAERSPGTRKLSAGEEHVPGHQAKL